VILHTLNATPTSSACSDCLRLLREGDAVLLLGDGVYAALKNTAACSGLIGSNAELYVLQPDAAAAGILGRIDARFSVIGYDGFVALSERFPRQQAW
jgi:tRNA 2-thiouridine synthesizing protein B